MSEKRALIVGTSRGIGLGLTEELAGRGWHVIATQRSPAPALEAAAGAANGAIEVVTADVTDPASFAAVARAIAPGSLDLVLVNAGIIGAEHQSAETATPAEVAEIMMTNAVGPAHAGKLFLPCCATAGRSPSPPRGWARSPSPRAGATSTG